MEQLLLTIAPNLKPQTGPKQQGNDNSIHKQKDKKENHLIKSFIQPLIWVNICIY